MSSLLTDNLLNKILILIFDKLKRGLIHSYILCLRAASFGYTFIFCQWSCLNQKFLSRIVTKQKCTPLPWIVPPVNCFLIALLSSSTVFHESTEVRYGELHNYTSPLQKHMLARFRCCTEFSIMGSSPRYPLRSHSLV